MRKIFLLTFLLFALASITTIAFEDKKKKSNINFVYKINANLDDLVLNYCTTYDSYTVNRLYSEKKILKEGKNLNIKTKQINRFRVSFKRKPLNPNLFKTIAKKADINFDYQNINETDLNYLTNSKKNFVKTLLPLISLQNQKILLDRSRLQEIKNCLNNKNTLPKSDLIFLVKISKKYKLKTDDKLKFQIVNELLDLVDIIQGLLKNLMLYLASIHTIILKELFLF